MKRIAVDMDDVLADTMTAYLELYNQEHNETISKTDLHGKAIWDVIPSDRFQKVAGYLRTAHFFDDLPVMQDSQEVLRRLSGHYEVFIATAAMEFPNSFSSKYRWLQQHFPFISPLNVVYCGDKSILNADYLVDDTPRHFLRFAGEGILFSSPHNLLVNSYRRVNNWREVESLFLPDGKPL